LKNTRPTFVVLNANCLDVLKTMEDNSIDSICTDPPYGLNFMNKGWDKVLPDPAIWKECFRVLKPGGHMVAFGAPKLYHRLACSIEDQGFEIRDSLMWIFRCLSDDTEILTRKGWISYKNLRCNLVQQEIMIYDINTGEMKWETPERWNEYANKDTAYSIKSNSTDQIVTRNHRCLVERNGKLVFVEAETLKQQENIPVLENMSTLRHPISNYNEGTGCKKKVLHKKMLGNAHFNGSFGQGSTRTAFRNERNSMRGMFKSCMEAQVSPKKDKSSNLFKQMQRKIKVSKFGLKQVRQDRNEISRYRFKRRKKPIMEGRSYLPEKERKVRKSINQVCQMSTRVSGYVKERRLCYGTQVVSSNTNEKTFTKNRMCSSHKSRCHRQSNRKFNVVFNKFRPQEVRTWSKYNTSLATVTPIFYSGTVFCPTVSTGAFIARRKHKMFITGNSGFPKSLDVSKAIDAAAGAEREVVGPPPYTRGAPTQSYNGQRKVSWDCQPGPITASATPDAKQWEGWGTALKPAYEPIILARKPLEGTVASNVLKYGTGGLNIDGCRIETTENLNGGAYAKTQSERHDGDESWRMKPGQAGDFVQPAGRFPANLILDEESGKLLDEQSGILKTGAAKPFVGEVKESASIGKKRSMLKGHSSNEGGASRFFYCAKASKKEREAGLGAMPSKKVSDGRTKTNNSPRLRDATERKNTHPTVKPISLMQWLVRLITPPGGIVLDPFTGSGSTGCAAMKEGFDFIGCDLSAEYVEIANKRIEHARPKQQEV